MLLCDLFAVSLQRLQRLCVKGIKNNKKRNSSHYFWPTIKQDIESYVKNCHVCKLVKPNKKLVTTGTFEVPDRRMAHVMVDICGPLPVSHNGYKYILTCLDRCSRVVAGLPLKQATASECAEAFLHGWVKLYGLPGVLTSDRGSNFSANLWQEMLKNLNIDSFSP